ncbi:response regulator [Pseudoalteromonas espejiana]|uniref:response regulator n=1 Tax=Pseudoalteromonas espejiana TaxID=28107 RepID=UPI001FEC7DAE|nr:response regulator [Pseudoalteromonas espejiana]
MQAQLNKNVLDTQPKHVKKTHSLNNFVHIFSLAPVAFLIALVICSFSVLLLYTLEKKEQQSEYIAKTQQLRKTLFDALERFDNQALYITQKDKIVAGFLQSQESYTQKQLSDLVKTQVSDNLTYKGYVIFDTDYNQLALWSKNNFDLAAYGFNNWLNRFSTRANKQSVEVFTVADTAFLISEINFTNNSVYTLTAFDLSKFLNAIIGKLNTQNYNLFITTPQFTLGSRGELNVSAIPNSISAASNRFPPTWRLHVQPRSAIVPPKVSRYDLFKLALIGFAVFAFVYYFLRLPKRLHDEIKQKNKLILNRESLFSSSLDALPHGFAIFNSNEIPVITNDAFNKLFEQVTKNNSQLSYSQLISISQQYNIINHYKEHNKLANEHNQLIEIGFTDGRWITVVQRHTDFGGFVCYFRDETESHQKELLLAQVLEKSKQSNQLKDKFVARLSSQLNAPITSLQSIIALAKGNNSNSNNYLKEIESASKQLKSVAQQLVNVNKSDSDKLKLKISTINLNELLNNSADIVNKEAENTNLIINNKLNENEGIMSDEKLIMQLVLHLSSELLENSYKGLLTLNTELTYKDSKNYLSLNFLINNLSNKSHFFSQLKHIVQSENFEKMESIDATLEVKFFMSVFKMLGGKSININERGKTTSISLSLLVNVVALTNSKAENKQNIVHLTDNKAKTTSKSLLLVDDEPLVEMVIKAMLKNENLNVDYASSAIEAMLMVSQNNYDIILMDIVMPELSGTDAMLKIKKHSSEKQTKIIAHTSDSQGSSSAKYVELGFDDMLEKPVKQDVLVNKIRKLIEAENLIK